MGEPATPYSSYLTEVPAEWVDYNGHMHDASYASALSDANEQLFAALGLSMDYRQTSGAAFYTVECHIRFLAECSLGQRLSARTTMLDASLKKIRLYTELLHDHGEPVATGDFLYLHVDAERATTSAMSGEYFERVREMLDAHAALARPAHLGRGIGAGGGSDRP
jgi:acyl-CoA thioesterase FadM